MKTGITLYDPISQQCQLFYRKKKQLNAVIKQSICDELPGGQICPLYTYFVVPTTCVEIS